MKVRDLMTAAPIVATRETSIRVVIDLMTEHKIRHVPLVEDGRAIGMLSQRDMTFLAGMLDMFTGLDDLFQDDATDMPVSDLDEMNINLTGVVYTVDADADVLEALDILVAKPISALVVTEDPDLKVVGVLS